MKILLLGHKGYLGSYLYGKIKDVHVENKNIEYDYVINCIGKPDLEYCENNPNISFESNYNIVNKILSTIKFNKLIHFSSYYVYDDMNECNETSNVTYDYNYTRHKLMGEKLALENNSIVFRIGKLFGHRNLSQQNKLTEFLMTTKEAVVDNILFNPTSLRQVYDIILFELSNNSLNGLYNLSNIGEKVTHYEYAVFLKDIYNKNLNIKYIEKHKRIFHNYGRFWMTSEKLNNIVRLNDWKEDMATYIGEMKCLASVN